MNDKAKSNSALLPSQAFDLAKLVDYADGAVVSRTIAENDSGTITLFAFDEGQNLSEHTAPFDAFVQILDGRAELVISSQAVEAIIWSLRGCSSSILERITRLTWF